jgi:hypothetical protein
VTENAETVVTVETPETPPVEDSAPDVVVVDTGSDSGGSHDLEIGAALGSLTAAVETLASRVDEIDARTAVAEIVAEDAADTASAAVEIAVETAEEAEAVAEDVAEETAEETVEEFIEPQRDHWLWRKPVNLRRARSDVDA